MQPRIKAQKVNYDKRRVKGIRYRWRDIAQAYKLGKITVYDTPVELAELGIKNAPQSFVYLKTSLV